MFHRRPTGLNTLVSEAGNSLARLNALDSFSRSLLVGIIPLLALEALGSKEAVTRAYLVASIMTLAITLNFASLEKWLHRRWVVTMAGGFIIIASAILYLANGYGFSVGIGMRAAAASLFSVCLSLYIMDYIGKKELIGVETRRMVFNGASWLIGPSLGIWLWNYTAHWVPFAAAAAAALGMIAYFWRLRLGPNVVIRKARSTSVNPLKIIPRYMAQPALRIAYLITLSRAIFWVSLFVFGPIYTVEAGLPVWVAGALLSLSSALMFLSPVVRRLSDIYGTRAIIISGQFLTAVSVIALFALGDPQPLGLVLWMTASLGGVMLDVLGNIPFMRLVKPRERTEMTMIFSTWREGAELLTPLIATLILLFAPFEAFYLFLGLLLFVAAGFSTFLPGRL